MKYTRIDVKNKKRSGGNNNNNDGKNFIFLFVGVVVIALLISTIMSKFIWPEGKLTGEKEAISKDVSNGDNKDKESKKSEAEKPKEEEKSTELEKKKPIAPTSNKEGQEYVMVQCGFYSNKDNANKIKSELEKDHIAVSLSEGENYRVIVHIGNEEEAKKLVGDLEAKGVSSTKGRFVIPRTDLCSNQIIEMVNGYVNIIDKLKEDSVKGVKTSEFKAWVNKLEDDKDSKNYEVFKELKEGINNIPEEITKENIEESYQIVFNTLNKFRVNK
ncbi:SPOR domain-containing protein [Clostridium sp.]|uniref:SPOR domain-containing protein n=1 Tax=Clostridium sp. TaxID=1506 RepID=UPI002615557C|nr:SPOR domain-containing protein [Clostridium sp.]